MHRIDKLQREFPYAGSRMPQGWLIQDGFKVGRVRLRLFALLRQNARARYQRLTVLGTMQLRSSNRAITHAAPYCGAVRRLEAQGLRTRIPNRTTNRRKVPGDEV